jgi:acetyltransferase-like isoleucine patch superfamily enzyme
MPGEIGFWLRYGFWKRKLRYLGNKVKIDTGVCFKNPDYIVIEDKCWIDKNVIILAGLDNSEREKIQIPNKYFRGEPGVVCIGKNIHIGPGCIISGISAGIYISNNCGFSANCKVFAFSHHYRSKKNPENSNIHFGPLVSHDMQCVMEGPVYVGFNTGFALNSVVLPGVSIPENCFISINSVVYPGRYTNNSVLSGNPAKKIADRFVKNE